MRAIDVPGGAVPHGSSGFAPLEAPQAFVFLALGNTPAVCRKSYVHPAVLDTLGAGEAPTRVEAGARCSGGLRAAEQRLWRLLRSLARAQRHNRAC